MKRGNHSFPLTGQQKIISLLHTKHFSGLKHLLKYSPHNTSWTGPEVFKTTLNRCLRVSARKVPRQTQKPIAASNNGITQTRTRLRRDDKQKKSATRRMTWTTHRPARTQDLVRTTLCRPPDPIGHYLKLTIKRQEIPIAPPRCVTHRLPNAHASLIIVWLGNTRQSQAPTEDDKCSRQALRTSRG